MPDDTGGTDDGRSELFASSPCLMHELDPTFGGSPLDREQARDVARWRKAERERLIAARQALSVQERTDHAHRLARQLDEIIPSGPTIIVGAYWPFRGEPDLRDWMGTMTTRGARVALPVVVAKGEPLVYREWHPQARLERGVWNIPFPVDGAAVMPTWVIAPLVGFDAACYRLGYGGGFFDRTLAVLHPRPAAVGVGHPVCALKTIFPQPHDIPMDWIVTGDAPATSRAGREQLPVTTSTRSA